MKHLRWPWHFLPMCIFVTALLVPLLTTRMASGAGIVVNTFADDNIVNGNCTLREAIIAANTDTAVDACPAGSGDDTIALAAGIYTLSVSGAGEDQAASGDLDILANLSISGAGANATLIDASGLGDRVFHVRSGSLTLSGLTVAGGDISGDGGGILNAGQTLTLINTVVRDNTASISGGGISNTGSTARLTISNSTIRNNQADDGGAGIYNFGGVADVTSTSIISNTVAKGVFGANKFGGGIKNVTGATLTVTNSTISGNQTADDGAGIYNNDATVTLANVTIVNNASISDAGGIDNFGTVNLKNTIIARNRAGGFAPDCRNLFGASFNSQGYNLVQNTADCTLSGDTTGNITGQAPQLGPLQDNGGPTLTHALLAGSPAIDAGNPAGCTGADGSPLTTDQRGAPRSVDGDGDSVARCDIGAYEFNASLLPSFSVTNTSDSGPGSLRQVILNANANPGTDTITFNIPGAGPHVIRPTSALPAIADPVVIDGSTQPGFAGYPLIELDGSTAGAGVNGLWIIAGSSTVRSLAITRFQGHGILLQTNGGNTIEGNTVTLNGGDGVRVADAAGNTISRNAIYENSGQGIANVNGGNGELTPPVLVGAVGNRVAGTAPPMAVVEIFGDSADEGQFFLGSITADAQGNFEFVGSLSGDNVTATATDGGGSTSEFAAPVLREAAIPDTFEPNDDWTMAQEISVGQAGLLSTSRLAQVPPVVASGVITSYISGPGDIDFYKLAVPERGSTVTFTLTGLAADFDLVLLSPTDTPADTPLQDIPLQDIPLQDIPLQDIPLQDIPLQDIPLQDIPLQDIPLQDIPLQDIPLQDISLQRGTASETVSDFVVRATDFYYAEVIGHNGVYSTQPYTLRVEIAPPVPPPPCSRTFPGPGTVGTVYQPFSAGDTQTLILVNRQRVEELYGSTAADSLMSRLRALADHTTVKGMVLPVETDPAVAAAYLNWDQNTCDPEAANEVAGAIKNLVSSTFAAFPNLAYIVIVGSDEVIPFRRVQDIVQTSNERDYLNLAGVKSDTALYASLEGGYILTDDFYADFEPSEYAGRPLYVANYPIGRLVEMPAEIVGQLDHYLASGGVLTATTSLSVGYDFLADSAVVISDTFGTQGLANDALIGDTWNAQDLTDAFLTSRHDINSLNAHFQHWRLEPGDRAGGLFQSDQIDQPTVDLAGTVNFSMGCHAGLNICDLISAGGPSSLDFAQALARKQAVYVANTGYGYGDTEAVAMSEELMKDFARNLGGAGSVPVGQALVSAKQEYALNNLGFYGPYDEKVLIEATLYGLPMYQVRISDFGFRISDTLTGSGRRLGLRVDSTQYALRPTQSPTGLIVRTYTITPTLAAVNTSSGTYYTADGETQAILYRPLQPRVSLDIALPSGVGGGAVAHGALLVSSTYTDIEPFDPVISMPISETTRYEPQWIYTGWQPQVLSRVNHFQTPQGLLESLVLILGQFRHTGVVGNHVEGAERLYDRVTYDVYYSASNDITPPTIVSVSAMPQAGSTSLSSGSTVRPQQGDTIHFVVKTRDSSGIERVVIVYTDGTGAWHSLELSYDPQADEWVGDLTGVAGEISFMAQVVDSAGNVGSSLAKGLYFTPLSVDAGGDVVADEGDEIAFNGSGPTGATVAWDFGDGLGATGSYAPIHQYRDDGLFQVNLRVSDEGGDIGTDTLSVTVHNVPPTVSITQVTTLASASICAGNAITLTAGFTDPGVLDTHTATIDWGDGVVEAGTVSQGAGAGTVSGSHTYTAAGTFTVEVCVTDDEGGTGCSTTPVTVRAGADLTAAFVTAEPAVLSTGAREQGSGGAEEHGSQGAREPGSRGARGRGRSGERGGASDHPGTQAPAHPSTLAQSSVIFTARVHNTGSAQAPAGVPVSFYADGTLIGTTATAQALAPGASELITVTWTAATAGDHAITIVADDPALGSGSGQIAECDEGNNTAQQTVSILDVPLVEGWNLISSYVDPFTKDVTVVQRPISGTYTVVQGFDGGALSYYPDLPPAVNTLTDIDTEHGYWIKVKPTGTQGNSGELRGAQGDSPEFLRVPQSSSESTHVWRFVGQKFAEDRPLALDAGWNLVSYLPRVSMPITQALQSIAGQYFAVLGYDQGAQSYYPDLDPSFNTLTTLEPLRGYWIKMMEVGTLQYPAVGDQGLEIRDSQSPASNLQSPISNLPLTSTWVNFYGPTSLLAGTLIQAVDPDGVVCGTAVVHAAGRYGLLVCYGDDPTTVEDEGAQPGDVVRLVVDGETLGTGTWTAHGERQWVPLGAVRLWKVRLPVVRR